jgi:phosphoglycolate phosphatase-like HAD superfamily hydrolase
MIKAVVFDWSGVLSDDLRLCHGVTRKMCGKLGRPPMSLREFRDRFDLPYMDFWRSMGVRNQKKELDSMYAEIFLRGKMPKPFPFAKKTLEWLRDRGLRMVVYSSHAQPLLDREVEGNGFSGFFSMVIGSAHDKRDSLADLMNRIGAAPEEVLFVGDMAHDIETGKAAGARTAAVLSGYHGREKLLGKGPNLLLNDVRDLKSVIEDGVF